MLGIWRCLAGHGSIHRCCCTQRTDPSRAPLTANTVALNLTSSSNRPSPSTSFENLHTTHPESYRERRNIYIYIAMATTGPPPKFAIDSSALDANPRPLKRRRRNIVPNLPLYEDAPDVLPAEMVAGLLNRSTAVIMKSMGFDSATAIAQERLRQLAEDCKREPWLVLRRGRFAYVCKQITSRCSTPCNCSPMPNDGHGRPSWISRICLHIPTSRCYRSRTS